MSTLVAEVYGPDYNKQVEIADKIKSILSGTNNVVDVDWNVEMTRKSIKFTVDKDKSMKLGIPNAQVVQSVTGALSGMPVGILHQPSMVNQVRSDPTDS